MDREPAQPDIKMIAMTQVWQYFMVLSFWVLPAMQISLVGDSGEAGGSYWLRRGNQVRKTTVCVRRVAMSSMGGGVAHIVPSWHEFGTVATITAAAGLGVRGVLVSGTGQSWTFGKDSGI
jgi:hypothetical protein